MTAVALRQPLPDGPPIDPYALAGRTGLFLAAEGRVLVGLGVAATLRLPHGLTTPGELDRALDDLAAIRCDDRLAGTTRASAATRSAPSGPFPSTVQRRRRSPCPPCSTAANRTAPNG